MTHLPSPQPASRILPSFGKYCLNIGCSPSVLTSSNSSDIDFFCQYSSHSSSSSGIYCLELIGLLRVNILVRFFQALVSLHFPQPHHNQKLIECLIEYFYPPGQAVAPAALFHAAEPEFPCRRGKEMLHCYGWMTGRSSQFRFQTRITDRFLKHPPQSPVSQVDEVSFEETDRTRNPRVFMEFSLPAYECVFFQQTMLVFRIPPSVLQPLTQDDVLVGYLIRCVRQSVFFDSLIDFLTQLFRNSLVGIYIEKPVSAGMFCSEIALLGEAFPGGFDDLGMNCIGNG